MSDLETLDNLLNGATSYIRLGGGIYKGPSKHETKEIQRKEEDIIIKRSSIKWVSTQYLSKYMSRRLGIDLKKLRELYFKCCL